MNDLKQMRNTFATSQGKGIGYRVRRSARARNVRLTLSARDGLTVVVPGHFDMRVIPSILEKKREWIESHLRRLRDVAAAAAPAPTVVLPERIDLPALGESWAVEYRPANTRAVGALVKLPAQRTVLPGKEEFSLGGLPVALPVDGQGRLIAYGAVHDLDACRAALTGWLRLRAREELVPLLGRLAEEKSLRFSDVFIRGQKTRWASCSSRGVINLSYKLLFLDPDFVRCVLLHELCHTVHMNHSPRFWALLSKFIPDCRIVHKRLRAGWTLVPAWVEERP